MLPIQDVMAPLADRGLCLHTYPHVEKPDKWVLVASTVQGDKSAHLEVDGKHLAAAFPPEGGKFIAERYANGWTLRLLHGEEERLVREFPPETSIFIALKDFFSTQLMTTLAPHLLNLTQTLGRM